MSVVADFDGHLYIKCSGTNYEVGLQHGKLAKAQIVNCIKGYDKLYQETAGIDWTEARRRGSSYIELLKAEAPDLVEEMKGIAEGAEVDELDIITLNVRSEIILTQFSGGCTSLAQSDPATKQVLVAQNWDWVPSIASSLIVLELNIPSKPKMLMISEAGIVGKYGINSDGLACCLNAIKSQATAMKLPVHIALRRIMESSSVDAAIKMLEEKGVASTANYLMGDKSGNLVTVEASPKGNRLVRQKSNFVYHTNHLVGPDPLVTDAPVLNSVFRYSRIAEVSEDKPCTIESFRERLSDTKNAPGSVCRLPKENATGLDACETLATMIMDVTNGKAQISFGRPDTNPELHTVSL